MAILLAGSTIFQILDTAIPTLLYSREYKSAEQQPRAERLANFEGVRRLTREEMSAEALCKTLHQPLQISSAFKGCFPGELVSLGAHALRGVSAAEGIFTLPEQKEEQTPLSLTPMKPTFR